MTAKRNELFELAYTTTNTSYFFVLVWFYNILLALLVKLQHETDTIQFELLHQSVWGGTCSRYVMFTQVIAKE